MDVIRYEHPLNERIRTLMRLEDLYGRALFFTGETAPPAHHAALVALFEIVREQKRVLDVEFAPHAFNIGINDGPAAGQTVAHVHIHLIPRYRGDVADPRGGVRSVLPAKSRYWTD